MEILKKIQKDVREAASLIELEVKYEPGPTEELDGFTASFSDLGVSCYGKTEERAVRSARRDLEAKLLEQPTVAHEILTAKRAASRRSKL